MERGCVQGHSTPPRAALPHVCRTRAQLFHPPEGSRGSTFPKHPVLTSYRYEMLFPSARHTSHAWVLSLPTPPCGEGRGLSPEACASCADTAHLELQLCTDIDWSQAQWPGTHFMWGDRRPRPQRVCI